MKRAIVYVDGFNLYHAIKGLSDPGLKWLDLWSLSEGFVRKQESLIGVNYFSAFATWRAAAYTRHRVYVAALRARGVSVIMGNFKKKDRVCYSCGEHWTAHEEKETDVHIAVRLVADVMQALCDRAIIISADSDLSLAIALAKRHAPSPLEVFVVAPPGRFSAARDLDPRLEITPGRLRKALLPDEVRNADGEIVAVRPSEWK